MVKNYNERYIKIKHDEVCNDECQLIVVNGIRTLSFLCFVKIKNLTFNQSAEALSYKALKFKYFL